MNSDSALAYSVDEAAEISRLKRTRIYHMIRNGELPARKAGRQTLILRADLERLLSDLPTAGKDDSNVEGRV